MSPSRYSMLLMVAFGALWALLEAVATHMTRSYSPFQVVWTRYAVHLAFMLAVWGWREPLSLVSTRRPVYQLARSALMLVMPASFVFGLMRGLSPNTLMSVFWVTPLLVLAFSAVLLREFAPTVLWLAAAGATAGAILVLDPQAPSGSLLWPLAPLVMAGSFSLYVVMTRALRAETSRANLFYTAFGVFIALSPLMPWVWVTPSRHDFAIMVAIGLIGWLSLYLLDRMAAASAVTESAPVSPAQAVVAVGLGALAGHFHPRPEFWAGLALLAAVALVTWLRAPALKVQTV